MSSLILSLTGGAAAGIALGGQPGDWVSATGSGINPTGAVSTLAPNAAGRLYLTPRRVTGSETYDRIGIEVTTGGTGSLAHLGCYTNDNGRPGTLIVDSGELDLSAPGVKTATIDETLEHTWVWDAALFNNTAATLRGLTLNFTSAIPQTADTAISLAGSMIVAQAYGALPATCPAPTGVDSRWFRVQYRLA